MKTKNTNKIYFIDLTEFKGNEPADLSDQDFRMVAELKKDGSRVCLITEKSIEELENEGNIAIAAWDGVIALNGQAVCNEHFQTLALHPCENLKNARQQSVRVLKEYWKAEKIRMIPIRPQAILNFAMV